MATINELKIMKRLDAVEKILGLESKDKGAAQGISMANVGNSTVPEVFKDECDALEERMQAENRADIEARLLLVEGEVANLKGRVVELEAKSHKHNFKRKKDGKKAG